MSKKKTPQNDTIKKLSYSKFLFPIVIILFTLIMVALFSVSTITKAKTECEDAYEMANSCEDRMLDQQENLTRALGRLNITLEDVKKYDEIYEAKAAEAKELQNELETKIEQAPTIVYQVPYRSVPDADSFNKAAFLEIMILRMENVADIIDQDYVDDQELQEVVSATYLTSKEFRDLYYNSKGVQLAMTETQGALFRANNDLLDELEDYFFEFDQYPKHNLEPRMKQIVYSLGSYLQGMQTTYFLR